MIPFDFQPRTRIVFGPQTLQRLGDLTGALGARRVLLVSDPGITAAGHTQTAVEILEGTGVETHVFQDVHQNPTTDDVEAGCQWARRYEPEIIVGLGGGSSMDCAKGINFIYSNGGTMHDYWGVGKALKPMLPMIAIPTTAGTGSETQSFALISDAKTRTKMACGDQKASFRVAILDPALTLTQPKRVTALTGIDALAHALETFVTKRRNSVSISFSREAWRLLAHNFARVLDTPEDLEARGGMQLGACFAGLAIENSMLGAAHALANPLTANFGIAHGQAIATMLPHVIRFNGERYASWYEELDELTGNTRVLRGAKNAVDHLARFVADLAQQVPLPLRLSEQGVGSDSLPALAEEASRQWTAQFNPREVEVPDLRQLYEQAF